LHKATYWHHVTQSIHVHCQILLSISFWRSTSLFHFFLQFEIQALKFLDATILNLGLNVRGIPRMVSLSSTSKIGGWLHGRLVSSANSSPRMEFVITNFRSNKLGARRLLNESYTCIWVFIHVECICFATCFCRSKHSFFNFMKAINHLNWNSLTLESQSPFPSSLILSYFQCQT